MQKTLKRYQYFEFKKNKKQQLIVITLKRVKLALIPK